MSVGESEWTNMNEDEKVNGWKSEWKRRNGKKVNKWKIFKRHIFKTANALAIFKNEIHNNETSDDILVHI